MADSRPPSDPAMPSEQARRVLADAVGESRPRTPEDGSDPTVPVAATVVIVRAGSDGPEVLMIERPDRGSFAGAWVFPGGKLEPADGDAADELAAARQAAARETFEEVGLRVDADALVPLSRWDPPPGLALRIRTWFFLSGDPGGVMTPAPAEVLAAEWARPADMLARHGRGEVALYPPTWVTLHELAEQSNWESLFAVARIGGVRRYETVARRGADGPVLLWPGDAAYENDGDADDTADAASRHRLDLSTLPWVYTRTD